jgi:hypothetical protein
LYSWYETQAATTQTLLDIIAVSYQNISPPDQILSNINSPLATEQMNLTATLIGGNSLVDTLKR